MVYEDIEGVLEMASKKFLWFSTSFAALRVTRH